MTERTTDALARVNSTLRTITGAVDGMRKAADERFAELTDRIEEIEAKGKAPGATGDRGSNTKAREHLQLFNSWLRSPHDTSRKQRLGDFEHNAGLEAKDVTIGTPAAGGFAVPEEIAREVERLEQKFSPVRRLVRVVQVGSSDFKHLVSLAGASSGWVGETGTRSATSTSQLRERTPTHGELYAYPQASNWSLDDMFFDVQSWLSDEIADAFSIAEGDAVIRGDGTNKPTGLLNTTPVATADFASPLRAAAAYQFVPSLSGSSPAVAEIMPDALITLLYSVNSRYRANGTWAMNSATQAAIRQLKDSQGQYLWQPGLIAGQPDRLLGYPVETWEQMDDIATNAFPVAFGDFRRAYLLTERGGLSVTVDPITNVGHTRFYVRRRVGGTVLNNDSLKFLRCTLA